MKLLKKIRLLLIKKLNATPNEFVYQCKSNLRLPSQVYIVKPICVEIEKKEFPIDKNFIKNEIIDAMKKELFEHLVFVDKPYFTGTLRAELYIADRSRSI